MGLVYYSINHELCEANQCSKLVITKYWVESSIIYLVFSVSLLISSIFIFKSKELPRIYSYAITIGLGSGAVLSGMLLFAISREINLSI